MKIIQSLVTLLSFLSISHAEVNQKSVEIDKITPLVVNDTAKEVIDFLQLTSTEVSLQSPDQGKTLTYRAVVPKTIEGFTVEAAVTYSQRTKMTSTFLILSSKNLGSIIFITPDVKSDKMAVDNKLKKTRTAKEVDELHYEARTELVWQKVLEMKPSIENQRYFYNADGVHIGTALVTPKFRSLVYHNHHLSTKQFLSKSIRTLAYK